MVKGIKQSKGDLTFDIINHILLLLVLIVCVYPLIFVVSASISDPAQVWSGNVWLFPKGITFSGYKTIFEKDSIWIGYKNSLIYMVVGTLVNLFMTFTAAYPLSRKDFRAKGFLMGMYTVTMFFNGGLIPTYLLVKSLNLLDSIWAMILPNAVAFWNIVVTKTYFQTNIPDELLEAASMDGCSNIKFLVRIVLPLSAPIIAVMALFYGVGHWNSYFNALIYLSSRDKYPLQLFLREILLQNQIQSQMLETTSGAQALLEQQKVAETIKYGVIIVSSLPMLIIYPFVQKHFVKGIMVGSIKG